MEKTEGPKLAKVVLDHPLTRGETQINEVTVRRPGAPEMRGLAMLPLLNMDVTALGTLLPRITIPPLHAADIAALDPADLFNLGAEVTNFLLGKRTEDNSPQA